MNAPLVIAVDFETLPIARRPVPARRGEISKWLTAALSFGDDADNCVIWPFRVGNHGYGEMRRNGLHWLAHRWICTQKHGASPAPNLDAAHLCGVRLCCNWRHIRWATRAANHADKRNHGTHLVGTKIGNSKLIESEVKAIRASTSCYPSLALEFGCSLSNIYAIKEGRSWRHLL